jgi:hypothetical protein
MKYLENSLLESIYFSITRFAVHTLLNYDLPTFELDTIQFGINSATEKCQILIIDYLWEVKTVYSE